MTKLKSIRLNRDPIKRIIRQLVKQERKEI